LGTVVGLQSAAMFQSVLSVVVQVKLLMTICRSEVAR
jgi:hypothetical protein